MSAAKRRKRRFTLNPSHVLLALVVFSVSVAATTTVTSRIGQLALNNAADLKCTPGKDYTCACGTPKDKCPKKQFPGGKDCPCNDETNGHITPGKCQAENICKGEPPKDGKMPEMPKMPEPKEPPKGEPPPPQDPCTASGLGNPFGEGSTSTARLDANGQPCPGTTPFNPFTNDPLGGATTSTTTLATTTTTATSTKKFSWTAIVKVVQDVKTAVTGVVTNAVQNAITTLGGTNPNQRPSDYQQNGGYYYTESAIEGIGGSVAVGHFTNPELNTFGAPQGSVGGNGAGGSSGASSANGGAGGSGGVPSTGGTSGVGITNDSATLSLLDRLRALLQALLQALFS